MKYRSYIKINNDKIIFFHDKLPKKKDLSSYIKDLNLNSIKNLINHIDPSIKIENTNSEVGKLFAIFAKHDNLLFEYLYEFVS